MGVAMRGDDGICGSLFSYIVVREELRSCWGGCEGAAG